MLGSRKGGNEREFVLAVVYIRYLLKYQFLRHWIFQNIDCSLHDSLPNLQHTNIPMDLLAIQLATHKGSSPTQKAKAHVLQLLQMIEVAHTKIAKITSSKGNLEAFLDKCVTSVTRPKLLREIADISVKVDETRGLLVDAKVAEEKRVERAAKREAAKAASAPVVGAAAVGVLGGITVNVNIQQGGTVHVEAGAPTRGTTKATKPRGAKASYKKQTIPKSVRKHVWNRYIGTERGEAPCYCCGTNRIDKAAFEAGHVIPEVRGGPATVENLRPICGECNRSMGDTNMREFAVKHYGRFI